jgi:hypothetical protein
MRGKELVEKESYTVSSTKELNVVKLRERNR